jgi:hypothetical protein
MALPSMEIMEIDLPRWRVARAREGGWAREGRIEFLLYNTKANRIGGMVDFIVPLSQYI